MTFHLDHPRLQALGKQKPPPHFHPFQEEYFTMLEGEMALEIEGKDGLLRPEDGEFCVKRWTNHRIYPPASAFEEGGPKKAVCLASGEQSFYNFQLDFLFFENWYAYQDLVVMKGAKPDLIQIMCVSAAAVVIHSARAERFPRLTRITQHSSGTRATRISHRRRGCRLAGTSRWASAFSSGVMSARCWAINRTSGIGARTGRWPVSGWRRTSSNADSLSGPRRRSNPAPPGGRLGAVGGLCTCI